MVSNKRCAGISGAFLALLHLRHILKLESLGLQLAYTGRRVAPPDAPPYTEYLDALGRVTVARILTPYSVINRRYFTVERFTSTNPRDLGTEHETVLASEEVPWLKISVPRIL
jgi:hypothetical protein